MKNNTNIVLIALGLLIIGLYQPITKASEVIAATSKANVVESVEARPGPTRAKAERLHMLSELPVWEQDIVQRMRKTSSATCSLCGCSTLDHFLVCISTFTCLFTHPFTICDSLLPSGGD